MDRGAMVGITSVSALARRSGVARSTLVNVVNGGPVSLAVVAKVADAVMALPGDLIVWTRVR